MCESRDGNNSTECFRSCYIDFDVNQRVDKMQRGDDVSLSPRQHPLEDVSCLRLPDHHGRCDVKPSSSRYAGSEVESPKTVSPLPKLHARTKSGLFSSLQSSPSGEKGVFSNDPLRMQGWPWQLHQYSPASSGRVCVDVGGRPHGVNPSAEPGDERVPGARCSSIAEGGCKLEAIKDASTRMHRHKHDVEGEPIIITSATQQDQTACAQGTFHMGVSKASKEHVRSENQGLRLEPKMETGVEISRRYICLLPQLLLAFCFFLAQT